MTAAQRLARIARSLRLSAITLRRSANQEESNALTLDTAALVLEGYASLDEVTAQARLDECLKDHPKFEAFDKDVAGTPDGRLS